MAIYSESEIRDFEARVRKFTSHTHDLLAAELLDQAAQVITQLLTDRQELIRQAQERDRIIRQIQVDVDRHVSVVNLFQRENARTKRTLTPTTTTEGSER